MHICFDIDGTVCENSPEMNHDDPMSILQHTRPKHAALVRLVKAMAEGHTISFVTARSEKVKGATTKQLKTWLPSIRGIDIFHRPFEPYEMMEAICYKLDSLRYLTPDLYVGDLPMDQSAAAAAGIPFMPAEWWAKGVPIETVTGEAFRPEAIRVKAYRLEYLDAEQNDGAVLLAARMGLTVTLNRFGLPVGLEENANQILQGTVRETAAPVAEQEVASTGGKA